MFRRPALRSGFEFPLVLRARPSLFRSARLRKGPGGDQVFVIAPDQDHKTRAHVRQVESGTMVGDQVVIHAGLDAGETVAASGSFKLREGVLVAVSAEPSQKQARAHSVGQD